MGREITLTTDERRALDALVPPDEQTGDLAADLAAAARETMRRRVENSERGGLVIGALHRAAGSWRTVEFVTGIPAMTARAWSRRPPGAPAATTTPEPRRT